MKLGIFGDSFADPCNTLNSIDRRQLGLSWVEILEKKYQVSLYSRGSSNLYFSYKTIIDNVDKFDYIVLCVTEPGRLFLTENIIKEVLSTDLHISGLNSMNYFKSRIDKLSTFSSVDKRTLLKIAESIENYYIYWKQNTEAENYHKLMILELERRFKNIILIPCFSNSYGSDLITETTALLEISNNELASKGFFQRFPDGFSNTPPLKEFNGRMLTDYRKNHLCQENNLILAQLIQDAIKNKFTGRLKIDAKKFVIPSNPLEYYLGLHNGVTAIGYPIPQS